MLSPHISHTSPTHLTHITHTRPSVALHVHPLASSPPHTLSPQESEGKAPAARELLERLVALQPIPLNYIHLMRLVRRTEGPTAARQVFARARRAEACSWQVYAAAASLEYQMGGGGGGGGAGGGGDGGEGEEEDGGVVAARILALAIDRFEDETPLALHCVRFLLERRDVTNARAVLERSLQVHAISTNLPHTSRSSRDVTNARAVLERSLQAPAGKVAHELWSAYLQLESVYGSPASLKAIEERKALALPAARTSSLYQLSSLHSFEGLWPAGERELKGLAEEVYVEVPGGVPREAAGATAAGATAAGGGHSAAKSDSHAYPSAIVAPNLALCVEYTGEPILLDSQPAPSGGGASGDSSLAQVVPYQVEALLEALPPKLTKGSLVDYPIESRDVHHLFERLRHLPDKLAELPLEARSFTGAAPGQGGWAAGDAAHKRGASRGHDAFTARQRKKLAVFGTQ